MSRGYDETKCGGMEPPEGYIPKYVKMKDKETKVRVNTRLPQSAIDRWHLFAFHNKKKKEEALEEIIKRGTKKG